MATSNQTSSGQPSPDARPCSRATPPALVGACESASHNRQTQENRCPDTSEAGGVIRSAASPSGNADSFTAHLQHLRWARDETNKILETYNPGHAKARDTLAQTWQLLFDLIQKLKPDELSEFNTLSSIIHRLCSSFTQIGSLEIKLCDYETERREREEQKQRLRHELNTAKQRQGLSPETLSDIEQMLQLL